jgi:hypothetical protein
MWMLTRNGEKFGYATTDKAAIEKYRGWWIDDHVVAEAAQVQLRLWNASKTTILQSEAEQIARDTLEEQIGVIEIKSQ